MHDMLIPDNMTICPNTAIPRVELTVGTGVVLTCSSGVGAAVVVDRLEWVSGAGQVLASALSVHTLDLVIDPVGDILQGSEFTCSTIRDDIRTNQSVSVLVIGEGKFFPTTLLPRT